MRTIVNILNQAGGWHPGLYLKIDNLPYMELVIEAVGEPGPLGCIDIFTSGAVLDLLSFGAWPLRDMS